MTIQVNKLVLAPMEGVVDSKMRQLLTEINHYDYCVTEFIRVTNSIVPKNSFYKIAAELKNNGMVNEVPIRIQLLGQHKDWLAENALKAIELGSHGIDLNFGCPAKTVNKSKGGAVLLNEPETLFKIISSVKAAIQGTSQELSVKIRLGYEDDSRFKEIIDAIESASADLLTIHARTKKHGYKPPAYWKHIAIAKGIFTKEVIANGEIWTIEDAKQCIEESETNSIMLGRGALATPNLANIIRDKESKMEWSTLCELLLKFLSLSVDNSNLYYPSSRLKQWLKYIKLQYSEANNLFNKIKPLNDKNEIHNIISNNM